VIAPQSLHTFSFFSLLFSFFTAPFIYGGIILQKLIVLGTGNAMVSKCYNTCFVLRLNGMDFLTDSGGGNGIFKQLDAVDIKRTSIHEMFITHEHCDHILGAVWMLRAIATAMLASKYDGDFTVYCHDGLVEKIRAMGDFTLQKKMTALFDSRIIFKAVADGETLKIAGCKTTFFDIGSTKARQFGYKMELPDGKTLAFMGDEPVAPHCEKYVQNAHWLLCEAFCLYSQADKFKPYEKHHSTAKDAAELAERLNVQNIVLWHTEESDLACRKQNYTAEAKNYFSGGIFVPDDLDEINL
jgi:ribonuclease Z